MNPIWLMSLLKMMYPQIRPVLKKAVDNPEETWDDVAMEVVDGIFGYEEVKSNVESL